MAASVKGTKIALLEELKQHIVYNEQIIEKLYNFAIRNGDTNQFTNATCLKAIYDILTKKTFTPYEISALQSASQFAPSGPCCCNPLLAVLNMARLGIMSKRDIRNAFISAFVASMLVRNIAQNDLYRRQDIETQRAKRELQDSLSWNLDMLRHAETAATTDYDKTMGTAVAVAAVEQKKLDQEKASNQKKAAATLLAWKITVDDKKLELEKQVADRERTSRDLDKFLELQLREIDRTFEILANLKSGDNWADNAWKKLDARKAIDTRTSMVNAHMMAKSQLLSRRSNMEELIRSLVQATHGDFKEITKWIGKRFDLGVSAAYADAVKFIKAALEHAREIASKIRSDAIELATSVAERADIAARMAHADVLSMASEFKVFVDDAKLIAGTVALLAAYVTVMFVAHNPALDERGVEVDEHVWQKRRRSAKRCLQDMETLSHLPILLADEDTDSDYQPTDSDYEPIEEQARAYVAVSRQKEKSLRI